jgi:peptidoglycan/LPS O-acetylase OafA/YrhL
LATTASAQRWDAVRGTRAPRLGVMLFFLLSEFLVSVLDIGRAPSPDAMRRYGLARVGRVVPLFLAVVVASYLLGKATIPWIAESARQIPDVKSLASHLATLGNISYSMYLLHVPILQAMDRFGLAEGAGGLLLFLAITVTASTLTYRLFERPMRLRIRGKDAPAA